MHGSESSTLEIDGYVWRYALIVVHASNERMVHCLSLVTALPLNQFSEQSTSYVFLPLPGLQSTVHSCVGYWCWGNEWKIHNCCRKARDEINIDTISSTELNEALQITFCLWFKRFSGLVFNSNEILENIFPHAAKYHVQNAVKDHHFSRQLYIVKQTYITCYKM